MPTCAQDNQSFATPEQLEQHLLSDHKIPGKPMADPTPPPPMSPEFLDTLKAMQEDKKKKVKELKPLPENHLPEMVQIKITPLELTYRYEGTDPGGHQVTTLIVDNEAGVYAIAYCIQENLQVKSLKVERLPRCDTITPVIKEKK